MNSLKEQINVDLKEALKAGDAFRRSVLGMLKSAVQNKEIEKRKKEEGLSDTEVQEVIRAEVKKRLDSSAAFKQAGQADRAAGEEQEAEILKKYLPPQASDAEIKAAVEKVLDEVGSRSKKDFGRIMGAAVKELGGRAEGGRVKTILEPMLE
ncbi:MAG: GatB/YqeY domain-containing protein [Parcubacteria group bacterium]|nr:GatB/YqeY domain-containing protein [Parcubacteria group bacterium]